MFVDVMTFLASSKFPHVGTYDGKVREAKIDGGSGVATLETRSRVC